MCSVYKLGRLVGLDGLWRQDYPWNRNRISDLKYKTSSLVQIVSFRDGSCRPQLRYRRDEIAGLNQFSQEINLEMATKVFKSDVPAHSA